MFGYVFPLKDELKIKDYEMFRRYYCGLCKTLSREFGYSAKFVLNYDLNFLGLLLSSLSPEDCVYEKIFCGLHPLKKKYGIKTNPALLYSAGMNILLAYYKFKDDGADSKGTSFFKGLLGQFLLHFNKKRAEKKYKNQSNSIEKNLRDLARLELQKCAVIDEVSDCFANLMKDLFCPDFPYALEQKSYLENLGYNMGRFIYIIDAFDDIEKDAGNDNYNPILLQFGFEDSHKSDISAFKNNCRERIYQILEFSLAVIAENYEKLKIYHNKELLDNIIYFGLRKKLDVIVKGETGIA